MFYHSLISDWNHGNAHFLRGVVSELLSRGHQVRVYEPENSWSRRNLLAEYGPGPAERFREAFPSLKSFFYRADSFDLDQVLGSADLVIVHEWNDPALVRRIGRHRLGNRNYRLLFHDTHHRCLTSPGEIAAFELINYDGVLAFGEEIRRIYLRRGWTRRAWTWHEAADTRIFRPLPPRAPAGDVVWIGNWGDEERTREMEEFLLRPIRSLNLRACVYGVRYPAPARSALAAAGITYRGWIPNYQVPRVFADFPVTVHVPRRPYAAALRGIPTIRVFEALACGIPLICSPWEDSEGLFAPGKDFLMARDGKEMEDLLGALLRDPGLREKLSRHGLQTVLARHTCGHRVDELLWIARETGLSAAPPSRSEGGQRYSGAASVFTT